MGEIIFNWDKLNLQEMELQAPTQALRAYSDPSIFRNDRVRMTRHYLLLNLRN